MIERKKERKKKNMNAYTPIYNIHAGKGCFYISFSVG